MNENADLLADAKLLYDTIFCPGEDMDNEGPMPPFEEARALQIGAYERCLEAAALLRSRLAGAGVKHD